MLIQLQDRPRFSLLEGQTPIQRLERLEYAIGRSDCPAIYVKRDDLMGLGGGGNKLRKLEFLLGDALAQGCDTFITTGARQSNHARLSAAAAARAGLDCELVLTDTVLREDEAYRRNGNVLLDDLFGATVHRRPAGTDVLADARRLAGELSASGRRPYVVGSGGSSPVGCLGYAACAGEIVVQERELGLSFGRIVVPNGSSGTHAGLAAGLKASAGWATSRLMSFTVLAPLESARDATRKLAAETLALLEPDRAFDEGDIVVSGAELGEGYGVPTAGMFEAVRLVARSEGLLLDPVYGGKAFAGLLAAIRSGAWGAEPVLFLMTGGIPGLFAYEPAFRAD